MYKPKRKWQEFKKLTTYREEEDTDVLPLFNENGDVVFDYTGKCEILRETFFGGAHIEGESFYEEFKDGVEQKIHEMKEKNNKDGDEFLSPFHMRKLRPLFKS